MDGERFDQLAKTLATSTSRRRLLGGLLGGTLAGLGLGKATAQGACSREAPIRCGNDCVDLRANPDHCGRCGRACAVGSVCYAGRCMTNCPNGLVACNGTCVRACSGDLQPDPASGCACGCPSELPTQCGTSCLPDGACCTNAECGTDDACTTHHCDNGTCGSEATDCDDGNACTLNTCDSVLGCQSEPLSNTSCGDSHICCDGVCCQQDEICMSGTCVSPPPPECESEAQCSHLDDQCNTGTCNTSTGACFAQPATGQSCNDGDLCTENDQCTSAGICQGTPIICTPNECQTGGTCNPQTGVCEFQNEQQYTDCGGPDNFCCNGVCCGDGAISCDAGTGFCSGSLIPCGEPCNPHLSACQVLGMCVNGTCPGDCH